MLYSISNKVILCSYKDLSPDHDCGYYNYDDVSSLIYAGCDTKSDVSDDSSIINFGYKNTVYQGVVFVFIERGYSCDDTYKDIYESYAYSNDDLYDDQVNLLHYGDDIRCVMPMYYYGVSSGFYPYSFNGMEKVLKNSLF